ncbi:MAG TPA: hypothetical protein VGR28_08810 [Candidatus Thermoplasmatota archaeon]|jgi:hypothetical protein|nr:hypothetical protein [Candidatus Thermoplasmatota archaeon]
MRNATYVLSALLVLASVGAVSATANDLVPDAPPSTEFLACYSLGIPFNYCYQLYFACVSIFGAFPGGYTFCYYV